MSTFLGIDLGWYGKPSGLASLRLDGGALHLVALARLAAVDEILNWIQSQCGNGDAVLGVDAPLVICSPTGIRPGERLLNAEFRRYHAGCHPANLSRPFAAGVLAFSQALSGMGFAHGAGLVARQPGRFQIEVHPHAATVNLFDLDRIVKYKRGTRAHRARELHRLRKLTTSRLAVLDPPLVAPRLPVIPRAGNLKPAEDQIDAVLCAYIAAHWWFWGRRRNSVYGTSDLGYIVVPHRYPAAHRANQVSMS